MHLHSLESNEDVDEFVRCAKRQVEGSTSSRGNEYTFADHGTNDENSRMA
jgi:hypothetical protein